MKRPEGITQNVWDKAVELANFTMSNSNATNAKLIAVTIMEAKAEQREKDAEICLAVMQDVSVEFPKSTSGVLAVVENTLAVAANRIENQ